MALWRLALALDFGTVHGNGDQLDQAHLARQAHHLNKQLGELAQVQGAELPYRAVGGKVLGCQHAKGHVFVELSGDLAGAEYAAGIRVDQDLDHHRRVKRLIARATCCVAHMKPTEVQAVYRVVDKVGQMALGQPVLQSTGQELLLFRVVGDVARTHAQYWISNFNNPHQENPFCRPDS